MARAIFERVAALPAPERDRFLRRALRDPATRRQLALSPAQRRLWLLHRFAPHSAVYNVPAVFRFRAAIDSEALRRALTDVCQRHEVLRSRFLEIDGEPVALLAEAGPDFRAVARPSADAAHDGTYNRLVAEEVRRPFELATEPPVRGLVITAAADDHLVVVTMQHIVTDARSLAIVLAELSSCYDAQLAGRPTALPQPQLQYADHTAWLADPARRGRLDADLEHWLAALSGAPAELDIPLDFERPATQTLRGGTVSATIPAGSVRRLLEIARQHGASPFMAFAAVYAVLLGQYSGQDDILIGFPEAGRSGSASELVGMFVNTVVLRSDLAGDPSFDSVLEQTRGAVLAAREHASVPLETVVRAFGAAGVRDRNPLFQAFFAYHPDDQSTFELGGATGVPWPTEVATAAFDLDLAVEAMPNGSARVTLTYATDLFARVTGERMLGHLGRIIEAVTRDATAPVSAVLVPDAAERAALATPARPPLPPTADCLHDFADRGIREHPDAVAVTHAGHRVTYRELDERANRLAWRLRALGVRPDTRVALCLPRDHRVLWVMLGILRSGGAYVPLDPTLPAERLRFQATDSGARIVVTDQVGLALLGSLPGSAVCLDEPAEALALAGCPATALPPAAGPGNLAYVLYTSGSTGQPKAVAVEHGSVVGLMEFYRTVLRPGDLAAVLGCTPIGFDATILEYFATMFFGGTVHMVESVFDRASLPDPEAITLIQIAPSLLARLLDHGPLPAKLALVLIGGEPLSAALPERIHAARPTARVFNIYGVTECTVDATWALISPGEHRRGLGDPLPGMRCHILDRRGNPVPAGARGELFLAGPAVARGYVNRDDLTRERFVPDPFHPGGRMYRTGDLARFRDDGQFEYLGRVDRQVKIHGSRVEPAEIEAALTAHQAVAAAAVVARPTGDGDRQLVAYIAVGDGGSVPSDLRTRLAARLPRHMVPSAMVALAALPLNPNGKLDISALPPAQAAAPPPADRPAQPRDDVEHMIARIWTDVLGRTVGVHDDFFAVGGESMAAMRVIARIREAFGADMPADTLFQFPTVAELADAVVTGNSSPTGVRVLRRHGTRPPLILVHSADAGVMPLVDLVRGLGDDRPVYGLEPVGLYDDDAPLRSVHDMADLYWKRLTDSGVVGPVVLVGWSMGGAIAYEMGRRAPAADGHRIIVIDTLFGDEGHPECAADQAVVKSRYMLLAAWSAARHDEAHDEQRLAAEGLDPKELADGRAPAEHLLEWARRNGLADAASTAAGLDRGARVLAANLHALDNYVPESAGVPTLFLASESDGHGRADPLVPLLGDLLTVRIVPGDHRTMLKPPRVAAAVAAATEWLS
ncbi:amino acid adenylation domain-containing protein [Nocardiopsis sp. NPDC006198]|uniref:non-ribosomal peptide synthetase n=1 Tax=Nocardiopsis sp. NPDC006198 TaxID=3154472 RepID=UPI0033A2D309